MRSVRRLLVVAGTILALTVLVPAASAASPLSQILLTKTCDLAGTLCTVQTSDQAVIPVGTTGFYSGPVFANRLSSEVLLTTPDGTATGHCTLSYSTGLGTCTFARGTGSLAGFHANLKVTTPDFVVFTWEGTYHFGPGD